MLSFDLYFFLFFVYLIIFLSTKFLAILLLEFLYFYLLWRSLCILQIFSLLLSLHSMAAVLSLQI